MKNIDLRITVIKKIKIRKKTDTRLIYFFFTLKLEKKTKQTNSKWFGKKLVCR